MRRASLLIVPGLSVSLILVGCGPTPPLAPKATVRLCAPAHIPARETVAAKRILGERLHRGLHVAGTTSMGKESGCVVVRFLGQDPVAHVREVMGVLRKRGQFVEGVFVPPPPPQFQSGEAVRYASDPVTRTNKRLPVVKPTFNWRGIRPSSVTLLSPKRPHRTSLLLKLKPPARTAWMHTRVGAVTTYILDRRVLFNLGLSDAPGPTIIIPGTFDSMARFSPRGAPALYSYLRFGPLPFSWASARRLSERR